MISDSPVQQFYAFNVPSNEASAAMAPAATTSYAELLAQTGFTNEMKLELFTMGQNIILMRVENLADIFDSEGVVVM